MMTTPSFNRLDPLSTTSTVPPEVVVAGAVFAGLTLIVTLALAARTFKLDRNSVRIRSFPITGIAGSGLVEVVRVTVTNRRDRQLVIDSVGISTTRHWSYVKRQVQDIDWAPPREPPFKLKPHATVTLHYRLDEEKDGALVAVWCRDIEFREYRRRHRPWNKLASTRRRKWSRRWHSFRYRPWGHDALRLQEARRQSSRKRS